ncbi:MAG: serine--tRNA ligase [Acidocella sp. 20-57-95]|nr:MAG: serine--tRNA ligase [Acidocella sp. 20-57-95]OYV59222.1 MAG: serine--tRNA ligase [Acidocella sp. 21-58-7]HQT64627.1 serine--tRNA ligase [Acidocella sp.]HQU04584.1 serine--tRNA ligase [Acidocella sp.]
MHDIRMIREDMDGFDKAMARRRVETSADEIKNFDDTRRAAVAQLQLLQANRNALAKRIGEAKRAKADTTDLEAEGAKLRGSMEQLEAEVPKLEAELRERISVLPNILDADVPDGRDEADNVVVKTFGEVRNFNFVPKQHFEIGEALGQMDFAGAAKLAGSRFTVLRGGLARLERALGQFMLDVHTTEHGYVETTVPLLVNDASMFGTGQLPKFKDDLFHTEDGRWLIPTAEVSLTNLVANDILAASQLPIRVTALTPCFRSEAGSAGRDVRGMLRQHQFPKVEMVSITHPETSDGEHERMTRCAETILERLGLPYRRLLLCAGDTGFSAAKTFDLEVWLPGQGMYREISSCSNTRAFQARRMNARYREADGKTLGFVHTLNGSGVAVGRALIAVLENFQNEDGTVNVPEILQPYMGGKKLISVG